MVLILRRERKSDPIKEQWREIDNIFFVARQCIKEAEAQERKAKWAHRKEIVSNIVNTILKG